jgi:hypothetical protein
MTSLYNSIHEDEVEYISDDYSRFMKDYKKFIKYIKGFKNDRSDSFKHAIDQIVEWVVSLENGLPVGYPRYEQFTWAIVTYDPTLRDGFGGLYDKKVTDEIIKHWEKVTDYKIHDIYKDLR